MAGHRRAKIAHEAQKVIYHGTPMTPRAALLDVLTGRAGCVSFFRPDDVEAVEAVCPRVMFRQRRVQLLDGSTQARRGVVRQAARLEAILRMAGGAAGRWALGGHSRHARRPVPAQRQPACGLAVRSIVRRAALAYGRAAGSAGASLRPLRHSCAGLDRRPEGRAGRLRWIPAPDGRGRQALRQPLAGHAHDAWDQGCARLSLHQRRRHEPCAERTPL